MEVDDALASSLKADGSRGELSMLSVCCTPFPDETLQLWTPVICTTASQQEPLTQMDVKKKVQL